MSKSKYIYGIDLGTTNSAIARFENEKPVIQKTKLGHDTMPSCVTVTRNGNINVGQKAYSQLGKDLQLAFTREGYSINTFVEFKRLMGTDEKILCTNLQRTFNPEKLSAEVLKELKKFVLDDEVKSAIITVPAMFDNNQKDATKRAAKMAGFDYFELIQEPVAASIAYGLDAKLKNAYWLVFDFGGGTFDAALMRIEDGIMKSVDTAGNNKLGGKDIDKAIVNEIFLPYFRENYSIEGVLTNKREDFVNMWKSKAEEAKIALSFNPSYEIETDLGEDYGVDDAGNPFEMNITITQEQFEKVAAPIYQQAIDITKELLVRNHLTGNQLGALILVGGPTHSPIVRRMLKEQITPNVDTSIDPMTCVACGAALYASTVELPDEVVEIHRDRSKIQLEIGCKKTTVESIEYASVKLLKEKSENCPYDEIQVVFSRNDGAFDTKVMANAIGDIAELALKEGMNSFSIACYDPMGNRLDCEPDTLNILMGVSVDEAAGLPMYIGIGVANEKGEEVFKKVDGLEKAHPLPANGIISDLLTPKDLRPGLSSDEIRISMYQTDDYDENNKPRALYCHRQYDIVINGNDIPQLLPAGSEVIIRMRADKSGTIEQFVVNIPYFDLDIDVTDRMTSSIKANASTSFVQNELETLRKKARELGDPTLMGKVSEVEKDFKWAQDRDSKDKAMSKMKDIGKEIDKEYSLGEWDRIEKKLRGAFKMLEADNEKYGNTTTSRQVEEMRKRVNQVINSKNIGMAKDLMDDMFDLNFQIARVEYYLAWIADWHKNFDTIAWKDANRARELLNKGLMMGGNSATAETLEPIIDQIIKLLPDSARPDILKMGK